MLLGLSINAQITIKGRILSYDDNSPIVGCIAFIDTSIAVYSKLTPAICSNDSGIFQLTCPEEFDKFILGFTMVGFEKLYIKDIYKIKDTIDIGDIWLFEGSYTWDGEVIRSYLFGLIKKRKGISGNVAGVIDKNEGKIMIDVNYPKNGQFKHFQITDRKMIIDYNDFKK